MGKLLKFTFGKQTVEAGITKIDRDKVYGFVQEVVTDKNGQPCCMGSLLDDGKTIILSGSTAIKTIDSQNFEVDKQKIKTVTSTGEEAAPVPSSFEVGIVLNEGSMDDVFNLEVKVIYQLTWENQESKDQILKILEGDRIFTFIFNYRADYEGADAVLVQNKQEIFALTGRMLAFDYLENKKTTIPDDAEDFTLEEEEELDFGML